MFFQVDLLLFVVFNEASFRGDVGRDDLWKGVLCFPGRLECLVVGCDRVEGVDLLLDCGQG